MSLPKSTAELMPRLTEVERTKIRMATSDGLEHLRQTIFLVDGLTPAVMAEVRVAVDASFAEGSKDENFWARQTWNF
jgi:hypothetical protein